MPTAAARLQDPRVSEAHGLVSLRGRELRLLALRGELRVGGQPEDDVILAVGLRIQLAPDLEVEVVDLRCPEEVTAVTVDDEPPLELSARAYSLVSAPHVELVPHYVPDAPALVWANGEDWTIRIGDRPPEPLRVGSSFVVEGTRLGVTRVPIAQAGAERTVTTRPVALTLVVRYTSVHVLRDRRQPFVVDGLPARLLTEVALLGAPAEWSVAAGQIWPAETDAVRLRQGWDRALRRLRSRLREGGVREDLVRADGCGNVELFLFPGDRVVDEA